MKDWATICRFGGLGDNLITSSVLPLLAKDYNIEVISQEPHSAVFENNPHISKLSVRKAGDIAGDGLAWQKWFVDRAKEVKLLVNLSHSCETMLAFVPGQTQFYWPTAWRQKWCDRSYLEVVHDICGVPHVYEPRFFVTEEERAIAQQTKQQLGNPVVGWCVSGTRLDKVYPYAAMAIARLIRETGVHVVLFGGPGRDLEYARIIQEHVERENSSLQGLSAAITDEEKQTDASPGAYHWPIRRSLSLLQQCDIVIGPDSGPMWAVAMEAMPKIMLLSHASARNITTGWVNTVTLQADPRRVPCHPCHLLHDSIETCTPNKDGKGAACISDISVETIIQETKQLLVATR